MCATEKKAHTSLCHGLMCGMIDACTHVDFPPYSSLFISLEQQGQGFICISNHRVKCFRLLGHCFRRKEVELCKVTGCIASLGYICWAKSIVFLEKPT